MILELSELLEQIDIVDYISQYVDLEEKNGEYWGISPFTFPPEKTPSFSVRRETGKFFDFSSGLGGTAICFTQHYNKCSKREAVEFLKKYAGVTGDLAPPKEKLAAVETFKRFLPPKRTQKPSKITVYPEDVMERYENDPDKLRAWLDEGISEASLRRFQVRYDPFSNRLVYPIRNPDGTIVNIGGRTLDPLWKEKNLRKYMYFSGWGTISTIYGLAENAEYFKTEREIILFEGCKSVLHADTWGIRNTGAILTSHLSPTQLKLLARLGCRVVFALDNDVDVRNDHNINKLRQYVAVEYIKDTENLLQEKDSPVDQGEEVFQRLYAARKRLR